LAMASCSSCGAERASIDAPCPKCGAPSRVGSAKLPDLELNVPASKAPKPPPQRKAKEEEVSLELAVDPRTFFDTGPAERPMALQHVPARQLGPMAREQSGGLAVGGLAFDARLLADYGDSPRHLLLSPFYAWRVLRRQRELRHALVVRRAEAERAAIEAEDALVALAERVQPAAEKLPAYASGLEELRRLEEVLRSRDRVLASEQDAQNVRLASVDARLAKLEADLAQAQAEERAIIAELGSTQSALGREEAKLKRAASELRAAQQREADGTRG
jgi:hypothetical protein